MDPQTINALTAAAVALGVRQAIPWVIRWASGGSEREKSRFRELVAERTQAEIERDSEAAYRRVIQEFCSVLIRTLIEHGVPPDKIPPWPKRST